MSILFLSFTQFNRTYSTKYWLNPKCLFHLYLTSYQVIIFYLLIVLSHKGLFHISLPALSHYILVISKQFQNVFVYLFLIKMLGGQQTGVCILCQHFWQETLKPQAFKAELCRHKSNKAMGEPFSGHLEMFRKGSQWTDKRWYWKTCTITALLDEPQSNSPHLSGFGQYLFSNFNHLLWLFSSYLIVITLILHDSRWL